MKKLILTIVSIFVVGASLAQIPAFKQTSGGSVDGYTLPRTVVNIVVTQEREVIVRGPYARYASQYLGIIGAAQTDKQIYKVLDIEIVGSEEPDPEHTYFFDAKSGVPVRVFSWLQPCQPIEDGQKSDANYEDAKLGNQNPFTDVGATIYAGANGTLSVDRNSSVAKNPEQMAAEAAATIFKIRKKRVEIICAEQGENVFGAGLEAALREMDKLEQEYISLFIGKRFTQVTKKVFSVVPTLGQDRIVACRFSDAKGVVEASDLSASPITLDLKPINGSNTDLLKVSGRSISVRIPQLVESKVVYGDTTWDNQRLAVFQFGTIIKVPVL